MKHIKINSKAGQNYLRMYQQSRNYNIDDCYKQASTAKRRESILCMQKMLDEGGTGYKIISYNTFFFSAAWQMKDGEGLRVETPSHSIIVD